MKIFRAILTGPIAVLSALLLFACAGPHPNRTHRGDLLDDKVTAQRVNSALQRNGQDFAQVRAAAKDGQVTLSGTVPSQEIRSRAEVITRSVQRVDRIDNQLEVQN